MNILLVDDQPSVLSSLKSGLNWSALLVHNVYTALNASEAREIILSHPIDILLTDIEMPKESGLSLLRWCRENHYQFECIFLTSHADFFYAQEAIQLESFDYILQPARYEDIESAIKRSIKRIQEKEQQQTWLNFGKAALPQKNALLKGLLNDWFMGKETDLDQVLHFLQEMKIPVSASSDVYLLWVQIQQWHSFPVAFEEWRQSTEEIFRDFFSPFQHQILSYFPDKTSIGILIYSLENKLMDADVYYARLNMIYSRITRQFSCSCAFYTRPSFQVSELSRTAAALQEERKNNICQSSGIFFSDSASVPQTITYCEPELLSQFEMYLSGNQAGKAEQEALLYLQSLNINNKLNHDTLVEFCKNYYHCAYSAARKLELPAHSLPAFEDVAGISSAVTLESAAAYLKKITSFFVSACSETETSDNSLAIIEKYIRENLDSPLQCAQIAKAVYLSPDYISRLFHKEKGMPLKEYITLTKMKAAKNLLITTSLPVSLIAAKVGYDNFSHFSKVYKKVMGTTPSSERNA